GCGQRIQLACRTCGSERDGLCGARIGGDVAGSARGLLDGRHRYLVAIGIAGLLAGDDPYADALHDVLAGLLDQAVLQAYRRGGAELEVEVTVVGAPRERRSEGMLERARRHAVTVVKETLGLCSLGHAVWYQR